jgi:hypothetical protein
MVLAKKAHQRRSMIVVLDEDSEINRNVKSRGFTIVASSMFDINYQPKVASLGADVTLQMVIFLLNHLIPILVHTGWQSMQMQHFIKSLFLCAMEGYLQPQLKTYISKI